MRIWTGDEGGLVKDIRLAPAGGSGAQQGGIVHQKIGSVNRSAGVQKLCRVDSARIASACRNGAVGILSDGNVVQNLQIFSPTLDADGNPVLNKFRKAEHFVGLHYSSKDSAIISCTDLGRVSYTSLDPLDKNGENGNISSESLSIDTTAFNSSVNPKFAASIAAKREGKPKKRVPQDLLFSMRVHESNTNIFVTGGEERDVALWDINSAPGVDGMRQPIWMARNVPHDYLDLRQPVWVTDLCFLDPMGDHSKILAGTGHHQLRLYDARTDSGDSKGKKSPGNRNRPTMNISVGENPVKSVCSMPGNDAYAFFADSIGHVGRVDLRNQKIVNSYKGPTGSISQVSVFDGQLAAVGLDRFLHVWNVENSANPTHKMYLKQKMSCLLIDSEFSPSPIEKRELDEDGEKEGNDDIFSKMMRVEK
ncbi:MAG: hypothetical protein SGCHY_001185 [Lobulomycetales sp.]